MKIQFIGAAHEVTGSCTLLTVGDHRYVIDCGMEQGVDVFENMQLPIVASEIDTVFLTHAHIDHSGMLPKLYKDGFRGKIYATEETANLCEIMLRDSAHIQEFEAQWQSRKSERKGEGPVEPVYTLADAIGALSLFRPTPYGQAVRVSENVTVRFTDVGHLLGSASIEIWMKENDQTRKIVFSGDVGNTNQPIIKDPQHVEETDYLVIESTYGNRLHEKPKDTLKELAGYIDTVLTRGGNLIIPSFAVGRTQEILYAIRSIKLAGMLKKHGDFPVYVDSPLAVEATGVFLQCGTACLDEETLAMVKKGVNPIWFEGLTLSVSSEDSKAINFDKRPKIILSASGMCEAGRIRHHLKHNLWKKENMVLFVGYQSQNSLGRLLVDGAKRVKLFGEEIIVRAEMAQLHGTSGHADQAGLIRWLEGFKVKPKTVYVNHGDDDACVAFRDLLVEKGYHAEAPYSGTEYDLLENKMTVYTDGNPVSSPKQTTRARKNAVHSDLVAAAEELLRLVQGRGECSNKDNAKLASQIRELIQKWR